ncbi:hypothetical protein AVEN_115442-1 [Araneus ventricosus]|uniref:Uncharacterized protein n=1 Tax=Araneus ventricosus TaxID=182803 RepID=A0A4Y2WUE3_ARAVE|nr:hypothetical protein AVEN_115442-1 [Araneus ventricosus]
MQVPCTNPRLRSTKERFCLKSRAFPDSLLEDHDGAVVRFRARGRRGKGSNLNSTKDPSCIGTLACEIARRGAHVFLLVWCGRPEMVGPDKDASTLATHHAHLQRGAGGLKILCHHLINLLRTLNSEYGEKATKGESSCISRFPGGTGQVAAAFL